MLEDGKLRAAAPECRYGPGWIYWNGHCYQFTSYHEDFLKAEEICNEQNAYLADILNKEEGDWIKSVLLLINPKGKLIFRTFIYDQSYFDIGQKIQLKLFFVT